MIEETASVSNSSLASIQRRLRDWIVAPSGVAAALASAGDSAAQSLAETVRSDARLSATERLDVYANAYFYRIRDCLAEDFGALRASLGDVRFHNLVTGYLIAHPPRHPSLRFVGDRLAGHVRDEVQSLPQDRRWVADLAELEWAILDAFDAPDSEVLSRETLLAIDPAAWSELRFSFQSALRRLDLTYPVERVRRFWDRDESIESVTDELDSLEPSTVSIVVWRSAERVSYRKLDASETLGLDFALAGGAFGSLCERLAEEVGDDEAPHLAAALLARWQGDGLVRDLAAS